MATTGTERSSRGSDGVDRNELAMMDTWPGRAAEFLMDSVVSLPLNVMEGKGRAVRMLCLAWFVVWMPPVMIVFVIPIVALIFTDIIAETWNGTL